MKAVVYARVSTAQQAEQGVSLDSQISKCNEYATGHGLRVIDIAIDALSGKDTNRPALQRVIKLAEKRKIQHILVWNIDRLTRSTIDGLMMVEMLTRKGVNLHEVEKSKVVDVTTSENEFFTTIELAIKKLERRKISDRTRTALAHKRAQGNRVSGKAPYGFTFENGKVVENPSEQATISRAKALQADGYSLRKISKQLELEGVYNREGKPFALRSMQILLAA